MKSIKEVLLLLSNSNMRKVHVIESNHLIEKLTYNSIPISISSIRVVHGRNINLSLVYEPILL